MKIAALALAVIVLCAGCKSKKKATDVALTETYTTASKLAVLHFPPDFAPGQAGDKVAVLTPLATSGYDEAIEIHFGTNDKPVTSALDEYARILHKPFAEYPDWTEKARRPGNCFKDFPGMEIAASFTGKKGKKLHYRSCAFFAAGHGFWLAYMAPDKTFGEDEPLLRRIVDATEIRQP